MVDNKVSDDTLNQILADIQTDGIEKIVVGAVITQDNGTVLLLKRTSDDFMGSLVELPSGTVENNESLIDTLVREVREETGLIVSSIESFISTFDYLSASGRKTRQVNFKVKTTQTDVVLSSEHETYYWCSVQTSERKQFTISPETRQVIQKSFV